jgi:hypothetical protein
MFPDFLEADVEFEVNSVITQWGVATKIKYEVPNSGST